MPPVETMVAMAGFALAASATPGPVNIIGAMTGARHGTARALPFVSGATVSFLALFLGLGGVMLAGTALAERWIASLSRPMLLFGSAYLLWMAWGLVRDDGVIGAGAPRGATTPGFWAGAMVQGLNPKAWLAALSALSSFVLPLPDPAMALAVFALLYGVICWLSLALWAWGGARVGHAMMRVFNRIMALALALSVVWMLVQGLF